MKMPTHRFVFSMHFFHTSVMAIYILKKLQKITIKINCTDGRSVAWNI